MRMKAEPGGAPRSQGTQGLSQSPGQTLGEAWGRHPPSPPTPPAASEGASHAQTLILDSQPLEL